MYTGHKTTLTLTLSYKFVRFIRFCHANSNLIGMNVRFVNDFAIKFLSFIETR